MHNRIILAKAFFWPPHFSQLFIATKSALKESPWSRQETHLSLHFSPPVQLVGGQPFSVASYASPCHISNVLSIFGHNHFSQFKLYCFFYISYDNNHVIPQRPHLYSDLAEIPSWFPPEKEFFIITDQWSNSASRQWSPWPPAEGCFLLTPTASWLP